jgi:hypothetical protein
VGVHRRITALPPPRRSAAKSSTHKPCSWHRSKILSGTKAGDLPIEDAPDYAIVFNLPHTFGGAVRVYDNFVRIHKTLRTTPATAANVTKRLWEIGDIVDVLEAWEANNAKKIVS